jgi:hypothetical protein
MLKNLFSFISKPSHKQPSLTTGTFVGNSFHSNQQLSNVEIAFLSLLEGKRANDPTVLGWWCSFNNIDRSRTISKLRTNNYLTLADYKFSIRKATIPKLKDFLQKHELPTKGKKDELVIRIIDNTSPDECARYFTDFYWALTSQAVELLHTQELKAHEEYSKDIALIRKGDYETLKRKLYPNRNEHWGTEDTFYGTIDFLMKHGFEGFGLSEDVRRNISSYVAARAVNYNSRGYSTCITDIFSYLMSVNVEINSLKLPDSLSKYIEENEIEVDDEIYDIYVRFIIYRARSIAELNNYKRLGYKKLSIDSAACQECGRSTKAKRYNINEAPLLPLNWNCGCMYLL